MLNCDNKECFNNDPTNTLLCDRCLEHLLMDKLSIDDIYDMFVDTKQILDQEGLFKKIITTIDPELIIDDQFDKEVEMFKENLFDIFNSIMRAKIAKDSSHDQ